jgi:DNA-binding SARP family transcriptional activator/class 3 adenylate cyclase
VPAGEEFPSGTVTFLFTDIEGSTRLVRELRGGYAEVSAAHRRLLRSAFQRYGGHEIDTQGDSFFVAFRRATDAVAAAASAQQALAEYRWPTGSDVRVRMGLHTGEPLLGAEGYQGLGVHRAARICAAGHGGQVLLSSVTRDLVEDDLPEGLGLLDVGEHRLKDLERPERIHQLLYPGMPTAFPALKTLAPQRADERDHTPAAPVAAPVARQFEFRLLGPLEARIGDRPLPLGGAKQRALLALLLLNANRVVSRERLIDELWGDNPPETAVTSVQVYVSRLRKLLPPEALVTRPPGYLLEVEPESLDLMRFERLLSDARQADSERASRLLREALQLWRGEALAEFSSEPFARVEGARLQDLRLAALEERIEADLALGRHTELIGELEQLIVEHPHRERLRAQLMLALYRSGRQAEALEEFRQARATLDELGIEPGEQLRRLEKQILTHDRTLETPRRRTNLPAQATPLIGRTRELAEVLELMRANRLVTLTGAGGSGKTSLALEAASRLVGEFPDGIWFVSLASLSDPELVEPTIAQAVGARGELREFLRRKQLLLLLDNLEQLLPDVAPTVAALEANVLATSRERLNVTAEQEYPVPTLPLADAVALFSRRARQLKPAFEPDEHVAEIARRLDGLPLALELAAAPRESADSGTDRRPSRTEQRHPHRRSARPAGAATHASCDTRMELRPAQPAGTAVVRIAWHLRKQFRPGHGRSRRRGGTRRAALAGRQEPAPANDRPRIPDVGNAARLCAHASGRCRGRNATASPARTHRTDR